MPEAHETRLAALRKAVAGLEQGGCRHEAAMFRLGLPGLDAALGGGLACGVLHEVYAARGQDAVAAAGFGLALALRAANGRALAWVRQDFVDAETGGLHGAGLAAFGFDPKRLLVVRAGDPTEALRATAEAARCAALGAVLMEVWGEPKILDLKASRRLTLAAGASGVTLVMIRLGAVPAPSSATSRWSVQGAASTPLEANAPGRPAFKAALLRHKAGLGPQTWRLEWDRDRTCLCDPAPLPRLVVPVPVGRPVAAAGAAAWRRAG